jgi:NAD(P)-dependent dehydrogenase (short-subunit alcohol dehydrogenase family)
MLRIDDLENKSVLITGASSGIGAALSLAFAQQGARVAVHWHSNRRKRHCPKIVVTANWSEPLI